MKIYLYLLVCLVAFASEVHAQNSGNIVYSEANRKLVRTPVALGAVPLPDNSGMLIPAHVQINIKADEHVAMFGLSQEGRTIQECIRKLDPQIENFISELKNIGLKAEDVTIDHTTQTRTYDYQIKGTVANEKATGFIVKKTISVRFREKEWMNKVIAAAAKSNVYDLIKVDYLVNDAISVRERLFAESARIIKEKAARYDKLLGLKFRTQIQIAQESYNTVFPTDSYNSYVAFETGKVSESAFSDRNLVKEARKDETFFFNTQDASNFDYIINPVVTDPVVQFSLYLQIRYLFDK
jgi:uncharacterized protein YggE